MDRREYFGRAVLLTIAAGLMYAINSGIRGNYGVLLGPISENSGLEYSSISFVLAVSQLTFGLMQPVFGVAALKRSNVFSLKCGIGLILLGMLCLPFCRSAVTLLLVLGICIPSGAAALSYGIIMGTISPFLPERMAPAVSGIVSACSGIGSAVFSPLLQRISAVRGIGGAALFLAVPALCLFPLTLYFGRLNHLPEKQEEKKNETQEMSLRRLLREALQNKNYRFLMAGFFTCGFHMAIIETHLYTQITGYGYSGQAAAFAFTIYGIATIIGSASSGMLCGRFPMKNVLGTLYASRVLWIAAFLALPKTAVTVYAFFVCLGLTGGATVPPTSGITLRLFGAKRLATLFGILFLCHQVGSFLSAGLGGVCVTLTGDCQLLWIADAILCALAAVVSYQITDCDSCTDQ